MDPAPEHGVGRRVAVGLRACESAARAHKGGGVLENERRAGLVVDPQLFDHLNCFFQALIK